MTFSEFLVLTSEEEEIQNKIKALKRSSRADEFLDKFIKEMDTGVLLKLAIVDPDIEAICKAPQFEEHWQNIWRLCGVNPGEMALTNGEPVHEYLPMATFSGCFELVKGLFVYEEYRRQLHIEQDKHPELSKEFYSEAEAYLMFSASCGCFFAMNALCKAGLELLKDEFNEDIALKVLALARIAAELYLSPGYYLLSQAYQDLLKFKNESFFAGLNLPVEAFKAAYLAERLADRSAAMINNAYQGKTLSEASDGLVRDFSQARSRVQTHLSLTSIEINLAIDKAKEVINKLPNPEQDQAGQLSVGLARISF